MGLIQADKIRYTKLIGGFLFDNGVDLAKEQDKEKVTNANNCSHRESTKTRKKGHQYDV